MPPPQPLKLRVGCHAHDHHDRTAGQECELPAQARVGCVVGASAHAAVAAGVMDAAAACRDLSWES